MKTLAGIVLFNPDVDRLKENINAIIQQVDDLILIDNGSGNINEVKAIHFHDKKYTIIENGNNLGIATALGQIMEYGIQYGYDWVLTLDQDSVCRPGLIDKYKQYVTLPEVGILTCSITDRNFVVNDSRNSIDDYYEIEKCITAASFMNVEAYRLCDGFDEEMFIDGVDFDICFNMRFHGKKIYRITYDGLLQEVGNGKNVKLFGKDYIIYNHSPFRCYYIARNNVYLAKKYKAVSMKHMLLKECAAEIATILYESDRWKKLTSRWKGLMDGIRMEVKQQ